MTLWDRLKQKEPGGPQKPVTPPGGVPVADMAPPPPPLPSLEPLSEQEKLAKLRVHDQVLKQLDLSVLSRLPEVEGREQIRMLAVQVMSEEGGTLSGAARQRVAKQIED